MKRTEIALPELGLIASTRGLLGIGIGLLIADRISEKPRKAVGWTLVLIGALSTIPLAWIVLGRRSDCQKTESTRHC